VQPSATIFSRAPRRYPPLLGHARESGHPGPLPQAENPERLIPIEQTGYRHPRRQAKPHRLAAQILAHCGAGIFDPQEGAALQFGVSESPRRSI
jgi:hypothetical protein